MKLSSIQVSKLFDRPISFHRCLADVAGSVDGGVFLSQAVYWTNRTTNSERWFYKTAIEWEEETRIKPDRQKTIRNCLVKIGVLEEKKEGIPCKLFYRINLEKLSELLDELTQNNVMESPETSIGSEPKQASAENPSQQGLPTDSILNSIEYTESTTVIPPYPQGGENVNATIPIVNSRPVRQRNMSDEMREMAFQNWLTIINEYGIKFTNYEILAIKSYAYSKPNLPIHEIESALYLLDKWVCDGKDIEDSLRQSLNTRSLIKPGLRVACDSKNNRIYDPTTLNIIRQNQLEREAKELNQQQSKV